MKTIKHDKDGVIIGIDQLQIDPEATKIKLKEEREKLESFKILNELTTELKKTGLSLKPEQYKIFQMKIKGAYHNYIKDLNELKKNTVVYFELRKNEIPFTEKLSKKIKKLKEDEILKIDGSIIKAEK